MDQSNRVEDLNDSWVELHYSQNTSPKSGMGLASSGSSCDLGAAAGYNSSIEKLLIDAQRESRTPSNTNSNDSSAKGSPSGSATPNTEWENQEWRLTKDPGTDWIWDWSSQPELPNSYENWSEKFRHPGSKPGRVPLSIRNSRVMKKTPLLSLANLPTLLLTHACTFFLGAAAVFIYFKKYCNLPAIAQATLD